MVEARGTGSPTGRAVSRQAISGQRVACKATSTEHSLSLLRRCCLSWVSWVSMCTQGHCPSPPGMLTQAQPAGTSSVPGVLSSPGPLNPCSGWGGAGVTPGGQESQCTHIFSRTKAKRSKFFSHFILRRTKIVIKTSTLLSRY